MIRPSTSGSTTFIVRSVGASPRVELAHASSEIPAKVTWSTGRVAAVEHRAFERRARL